MKDSRGNFANKIPTTSAHLITPVSYQSLFWCLSGIPAREGAHLPVEVDLRIIAVLRLAGVASGECAEEGIGQKTGYLLLRHSQGVVHP